MPFQKQNRHKADIIKQNKFIEKRLIEISICVDNYIYNNKAITLTEAENYAHEIFTYKLQCNADIRMLQVIEKLTRFMKSIIEDTSKRTVNQNAIASVIEKRRVLSFMPAADKEDSSGMSAIDSKSFDILAFKNIVRNNIEEKSTNNIENEPQKCAIANENQNYKINAITPTFPANIANSSEVTNIPTQNFNIGQRKHNHDNGNCGFVNEKTKKMKPNKGRLITKLKPKANIKNTHRKFTSPLISYPNPEVKICKDTSTLLLQQDQSADENNTVKKKISKPTDPKATGKKRKRAPKNNNKENNKVTGHTEKPLRRVTNKKQKTTQSNNSIRNSSPELLPTNTYVTPNNRRTCVNIVDDEVSLPASWDERNGLTDISKHMQSLKINKQFVENDLSWVDGIRFVREVGSAEFAATSNNLDESFWDNYTLPCGWDDSEFLY